MNSSTEEYPSLSVQAPLSAAKGRTSNEAAAEQTRAAGPETSRESAPSRLGYLDWLRGLAAVIMLQGHVFHSFTLPALRDGAIYQLSQFLGGMPPAMFLFLTGITLAFLMDSSDRKGLAVRAKLGAVLRRAGFLLSMAYLLRLQLWLFAWPQNPWTDLLKVDILNCMGVGVVAMSALALVSTFDRIRWAAFAGVAIAALSPLVSAANWTAPPEIVRNHVAPSLEFFSFFPWTAYLAFGISAGSLLRYVPSGQIERVMQWSALLGMALAGVAHYLANIPYSVYPNSEFWLNNPTQIFIKTGVVMVLTPIAYLWNQFVIGNRWNWLRQLGATSLLVYWVHIELAYGNWFWRWKERSSTAETALAALAVIALMVALSAARTRWHQWKGYLPEVVYRPLGIFTA